MLCKSGYFGAKVVFKDMSKDEGHVDRVEIWMGQLWKEEKTTSGRLGGII